MTRWRSCQVLPMRSGAFLTARAFEWRGVTLSYPARSRSGLRDADGVVVFAMPRCRVRVNDWGCSCLLWLPSDTGHGEELAGAIGRERLRHCRLAVRLGMAEGFLLDAHGVPAAPTEVLSLRVMRAGAEYWATWGGVARASGRRGTAEDARPAQFARHGG